MFENDDNDDNDVTNDDEVNNCTYYIPNQSNSKTHTF
jgi:hypothetical protein